MLNPARRMKLWIVAVCTLVLGGCPVDFVGNRPLDLSPASLDFGTAGNELTLEIAGRAGDLADWSLAPSETWLTVSPSQGVGNGEVKISLDRSSLPPGTHMAEIAVTSNLGNVTVSVSVTMPEPTGLTGTIAFVSNRSGSFQIYTVNVATKEVLQLTSDFGNHVNLSGSWDADVLAYATGQQDNHDIHSIGALGSRGPFVRVGVDDDNYPSVSPDGQKIAFLRFSSTSTAPSLYVYDLSFGKESRLNNRQTVVLPTGRYGMTQFYIGQSRPGWSPDSSKIVVAANQGLFVPTSYLLEFDAADPNADVRAIRVDASIGLTQDTWAAFSPDGTELAVATGAGLSVINLQGQPVTRGLSGGTGTPAAPAWSPDGKYIVYSSAGDIYAVAVVAANGQHKRVQLTEGAADDQTPVWQP